MLLAFYMLINFLLLKTEQKLRIFWTKKTSPKCLHARKCNRCWRKLCNGQLYNL